MPAQAGIQRTIYKVVMIVGSDSVVVAMQGATFAQTSSATFSAGGTYSLGGTAGQPDAQPPTTGGAYALQGGFWSPPGYVIYTPITRKP